MQFDITNEHLRLHPGRFVRTDLSRAQPVASGVPGLHLIALPASIMTERGHRLDDGPDEVFMVVPSEPPAVNEVVGLERRITLLTNRNDLGRGTNGEHLTVWMPLTIVQDLVARAA